MASSTIPVDLFNPGQVFGCLGLLEAADTLLGEARGGFDWSDPEAARFSFEANGDTDPLAKILTFLAGAQVRSLAPACSEHSTDRWDVPTDRLELDEPFPYPEPSSPATLPAVLVNGDEQLTIEHWGDATVRDNVKFWAGAGGYPGAGLLRDALGLVRERLPEAVADPFGLTAAQSSSFRFDWRRDYVPLGVGFSLNAHAKMVPLGYPVVEILAALGLAHARPLRPSRRTKLLYRYAVLGGDAIPLCLHRAALGCASLPFPTRTFRITLEWPGQENQARCITDVVEETTP